MTAIFTIYVFIGVFLMSVMTFQMAKYNNRSPWLWAILTAFFGAFPMAYVFFAKPKKR